MKRARILEAEQKGLRESLSVEDAVPERETTPRDRSRAEPTQSGTADEIKERRRSLLAEYKAATENPSNRRIYAASNSGIHKPDFYAWLKGELSPESAMSINFERFLRLKKPPVPRKPKD